MITVYGAPPTRALRVLWMLEEMGLEYEVRPVDFATRLEDAEFMAASPAGSMPAIRDGNAKCSSPAQSWSTWGRSMGRHPLHRPSVIRAIRLTCPFSILARRP